MKILLKISINFFDIIDKYVHQKKILNFFIRKKLSLNNFVDVGSHKGLYTDLFIKNFKLKKIIMFEPQIQIYQFLKKKYKKNKKIKIYNNAVSNKKGFQTLRLNYHDLTTTLSERNNKNLYLKLKAILFGVNNMTYSNIDIKTIKLESIFKSKKMEKVDLLKIDTEGHELQVLQGLDKKIKKIRFILIEFHHDKIYLKYNPQKIHNYLIKKNFVLEAKFKFPFTPWEDRIYLNKHDHQ
jgi:FkbM family methyltransferase|tara:strand:+ start:203 stop:916 length:714 start_codon:yes stop_codon:yes gene_type:complete